MAFFDDFKKFAFKGNVIDLSVGVVIGGAFQRIVTATVEDFVMPLVSLFIPQGNWRDAGMVLRHGTATKDDVVLGYGHLLGQVFDFFAISMVLFILVKRLLRAAEAHLLHQESQRAPTTKTCPECLTDVPLAARRCRACTAELAAA